MGWDGIALLATKATHDWSFQVCISVHLEPPGQHIAACAAFQGACNYVAVSVETFGGHRPSVMNDESILPVKT
jgi:hypothetical protein